MSTDATVAIAIFAVGMLATIALGIAAVRGRDADLSEWSVGGRSFGVLLTWVLLAGESYTSFSYLGAAGWAYGYGAPIFYLVGYMATGYVTVYLFAPMVWGYAKRHNLISISDILAHRFRSPRFGVFVTIVATIALLPYIQLQIQGMGLVVSAMSYGEIGLKTAFVIAFVVSVGFVLISGLRGSAWVSVLKDALVILTIAFLAIYLPLKLFGSYGNLFERLRTERPEWLTLPGNESPGLGVLWFVSTCILNGVAFTVFPSFVAGYLGSKSPNTIRRNAIFLPMYSLLLLVPMMLGMAAIFVVPNLDTNDLALLSMVTRELPAWVVGIIGVAGALSAIVPMAVFMLCIGTMWGKSVIGLGRDDPARHKRLLAARRGRQRAGRARRRARLPGRAGAALGALLRGCRAARPGGCRRAAVAADDGRGRHRGHRRRLGDRVPAGAVGQRPVPRHQRRPARADRQRAGQRHGEPGAA